MVVEEVKRRQGDLLDKEIERLQASVKRLSDQERRLIRLLTLGEIDESKSRKRRSSYGHNAQSSRPSW